MVGAKESPAGLKNILAFVLNFRKGFPCKISSATISQKQPQAKLVFTFTKISPAFQSHLLNSVLIKHFKLCIDTHACLEINQYSTGLFVSYSTHRKTQLYKNKNLLSHFNTKMELIGESGLLSTLPSQWPEL